MVKKKKEQPVVETSAKTAGEQVAEAGSQAEEMAVLLQEIDYLKLQLDEARQKSDENLNGWQRALADFSNLKRRVERDQAQANQTASGNIIKRYLDVIDDLDRALKNRPQDGEGANWANGIELIFRKFSNILESEGVRPIPTDGEQFDPNLHEAISMEENPGFESGRIIGVVQQGYTLGDRVLRPARVRVAR